MILRAATGDPGPRVGERGMAFVVGVVALALLSSPAAAPGQVPEPTNGLLHAPASEPADPVLRAAPQDTASAVPVSPGGAFLRSLVVPGWGHASIGSYGRASFYFLTSASVGWMLFKTLRFVGAAQAQRDLIEDEVEASLMRQGVNDPETLAARLDEDPRVQGVRDLVDSRSRQREDWIAFGVFWLLLNATDAFVSTHLTDFPEPVELNVRPDPPGGAAELRISLPVPGF